MSAPAAHRMSRVDTAWLRMDNDANLMMIVGVWMIEPTLALAELRERVASRLLKYDRFRQKAVEDTMGAHWLEDDNFDIAAHVLPETLSPGPGQSAMDALKDRVAELTATPLDRDRPLWQFHLIEHLDEGSGQGRSAFVMRVHHCIGDGISLVSVMLSLTDGGQPPPERQRAAHDEDEETDWLMDTLVKPITNLTIKAIGVTGGGMAKGIDLMAQQSHPLEGGAELAKMSYQVLSDAASMLLMPDDSPTSLKGKATPGKKVAWGEPLSLDLVKTVGQGLGASINDVLLTCVAGAIGDYLRSRGEDPAGKEIRAMVPVNLRPMDQAWKLGNRFGLAPLVLPVGIANPIARLDAVRARMNDLKGGYQPVLAFAMLAVAGLLIKPMQDALLGLFSKKTTAVMTNVPGPRDALMLCGRTLKQVMFWVPQSGDIGVGVSILSYAGNVQFGLITDDVLCPQPDQIVSRFQPEFDKLLYLSLMLPWEGQAAA
jgi:diacylglycerol O-acyltransferase / wax synthase